ncbi:MAG: 3-oxoadipate enol-lactonase [Gammaproteobacteria bacterium]|jgi:3-oxoadipate enol-lactonase
MEWIDINGTCLRYEVSGQGTSPLVLIHELGGSLESWDEVLPTLEADFRVLRYDQRGCGLSQKIATLSIDDVLSDLWALLDVADFGEPAAVVGTALGGGYAVAYAAHDRERVSRVVATSPATGVTGERGNALMARAEAVHNGGMRVAVEASLNLSYPDSLRENAARFARYRARWLGNDPMSFAALNRMLATTDMSVTFDRVKCEVLMLGATLDPLRRPADVKKLAGMLSKSTYREVEAGHFLAVQSPQMFLDETLSFLKGA